MTRYARSLARDRTPARPLPRAVTLLAVLASVVVTALPAAAADPVPPAGSVTVVVLQSDGLALLPVGVATVPPLACAPGGAP